MNQYIENINNERNNANIPLYNSYSVPLNYYNNYNYNPNFPPSYY